MDAWGLFWHPAPKGRDTVLVGLDMTKGAYEIQIEFKCFIWKEKGMGFWGFVLKWIASCGLGMKSWTSQAVRV